MTSASTSWAEGAASSPDDTAPPELAQLPQRPPDALSDESWLHGERPLPGSPCVLISQTALQQVQAHAHSDLSSELGGALLGHAYRHDGHLFVEISAAIPAVSNERGPVHFTFTADAWAQIHRDRAAAYDDLEIVGWFHTHPNLSVFFSSDDVVVHTAAFVQPWHVALVVDPARSEAAFFGWRDRMIVPLAGYYELPDLQPDPIVDWQAVRTAVWRDAGSVRDGTIPPAIGNRIAMPASQRPLLLPLPTGGLLAAVAAGLTIVVLLSALFLLNQRLGRLETVALALAGPARAEQAASGAAICPDPRLQLLAPAAGQAVPAGDSVEVVGSATFPNAARYLLSIRAAGREEWTALGYARRPTRLGRLATWDTAVFEPGVYELRLTAVDGDNFILARNATPAGAAALTDLEPAACIIRVPLVSP